MNESLLLFLNNITHQNSFLDALILFGANALGWVLIAGVIYFLATERIRRVSRELEGKPKEKRDPMHKTELAVIFITALGAWIVAQVFKEIISAPRPFLALPDVKPLFIHGDIDSFPSGHATFFGALATGLYFYHKQIAYWYFAGALVIGLSRVIAGVHWPIDILAGYVLGGVIAYVVYQKYKKEIVK